MLDAQNIGLSDGGMVKGVPKDGLRDTVVDRANFGKYLREQPAAGMINPDQPTQHGHYPVRGAPARYDDVGPRFNNKQARYNITIPAGTPSRGKLEFDWGNKAVGKYTYQLKEGDKPGDKVLVDLNAPGAEWWRGVRKGKAQLLWETGHVNPAHDNIGVEWINDWAKDYKANDAEIQSMARRTDGKKNATLHLEARVDFQQEKTVLEKLFIRYGHFVLASPRYHPELAGLGIEFCWGKGKWCFRRQVNDLVSKHLETNVLVSLGSQSFKMYGSGEMCDAPLPVERVRKFARRARMYRKLFNLYPTPESAAAALKVWKDGGEDGTECIKLTNSLGESVQLGKAKKHANFYSMIEKMYTAAKTHRNIIDIEFAVCSKY